ncbi:hypothetical protein PRIPAC_76772, partial [Pristionchus pacificus]
VINRRGREKAREREYREDKTTREEFALTFSLLFSLIIMEDHRMCLVCSAQINSVHLGMDVCRACASFFKRAKLTGVEYPCRQGNHQCSVEKDSKFSCRRCRFDKCLDVGLIYDGNMRIRTKRVTSLLSKIEKEFKSMIERRRTKELAFMKTCQFAVLVPHPKQEIYVVQADSSFDLFSIAVDECMAFFNNVFPSLNTIAKREKENLFKEYTIKFGIVVSYYLTMKLWGNIHHKLMSSVVTCYDTDIPVDFYYPEEHVNKDIFERSIHSYNDEHSALFLHQFNKCQLTEKEYYALSALVLTEYDAPISEEAQQILDEIRHETLKNLQSYYRNELGLTDISLRLGNLMSLNHTIQECQSLYRVVMRFYSTFFDTYLTEKFMNMMVL